MADIDSFYEVPIKIKMSAEIENSKEEDIKEQRRPLHKRLLEFWQLGFKIVELLICGVCMGLIYDPAKVTGLGKSHLHHVGVMYTAYTGFMLINGVLIIGRAIQDRLCYRTSAIFSAAGCIMFLVTAILLISDRSYLTKNYFYHPEMYLMEMLTTSTIFAFLNAIIFLVDSILTFKKKEDF